MNFVELFLDCFQQGIRAVFELTPLLMAPSLTNIEHVNVDPTIPKPVCLGELVVRFLGPRRYTVTIDDHAPPLLHHV
jgi:hypothetical protein